MDEKICNLLKKYLNSQCTPDEIKQVKSIMHNHQEQYEEEWAAVLEEDAKKIMNSDISAGLDSAETERLLGRILQSTGMETAPGNHRWWLRVAASVLILLTAGLAAVLIFSSVGMNHTSTLPGEQAELLLPDGTRVWLHDQSSLRYADEFDGDTRDVILEGSAFFDVTANPGKPFRVHSDQVIVGVVGTSFRVRAYEDDQNVTVTVASGSVDVSLPAEEGNNKTSSPESSCCGTLAPGDEFVYNKITTEFFHQKIAIQDAVELKEGTLIFQDQPLGDVARALERRFNLRFRFEDESTRKNRLTFKPTSSDPGEILRVLSLAAGFDYELNNEEVWIKDSK